MFKITNFSSLYIKENISDYEKIFHLNDIVLLIYKCMSVYHYMCFLISSLVGLL